MNLSSFRSCLGLSLLVWNFYRFVCDLYSTIIIYYQWSTVYSKRNAHLIPIFFVAPWGRGAKNSHGRLWKKMSMYRAPIYIIDLVNFWPPSPRGVTKKIGIKCAFLLTQTVVVYLITWSVTFELRLHDFNIQFLSITHLGNHHRVGSGYYSPTPHTPCYRRIHKVG